MLQTKTSHLWKVRYVIILLGWQYAVCTHHFIHSEFCHFISSHCFQTIFPHFQFELLSNQEFHGLLLTKCPRIFQNCLFFIEFAGLVMKNHLYDGCARKVKRNINNITKKKHKKISFNHVKLSIYSKIFDREREGGGALPIWSDRYVPPPSLRVGAYQVKCTSSKKEKKKDHSV